MYNICIHSWNWLGRACLISSTTKTSTKWRNSCLRQRCTLVSVFLMQQVSPPELQYCANVLSHTSFPYFFQGDSLSCDFFSTWSWATVPLFFAKADSLSWVRWPWTIPWKCSHRHCALLHHSPLFSVHCLYNTAACYYIFVFFLPLHWVSFLLCFFFLFSLQL